MKAWIAGALVVYFLSLAAEAALPPMEVIGQALPVYDEASRSVRDPQETDAFPPLRVLLSRRRYWKQDGHLDVIVQFSEPDPAGELRVSIAGDGGDEPRRFVFAPLPGPRFIFYPAIPKMAAGGGMGEIRLAWVRNGETVADETRSFRVETYPQPADRHGRIRLSVANASGIVQTGVPMTVGVPFPRGVLYDSAHLRLMAGGGAVPEREVPLQVLETARWSKFGTLRWVLCDFIIDLDGGPLELHLEYGPEVRRAQRSPITVSGSSGFPAVGAGRLRFDRGLWFDPAGNGSYVQVLDEDALAGAFVEHEDGRLYRVPADTGWQIEESGPEKVVLCGEGWYREVGGVREFCRYVIRWVIHRDSPLVRVFHTWVFTGDSRNDRIRNMGWRFALPDGFNGRGFLASFEDGGAWRNGDYLLQYDYEHYELSAGAETIEFPGGRAPGAAAARGAGVDLLFGVRDFWQNYPSELEFHAGALWFHNWPRHNRPAGHTFEKQWVLERGEPAVSASAARYAFEAPDRLTRSEWTLNVLQHRYAHEGRVLDFDLPRVFAAPPLSWTGDHAYAIEAVNAQGIARTEEMWLVFAPAGDVPAGDGAGPLLQALNDETLRAVVDPAWLARSGAMNNIHPRDPQNFPDAERSYELAAFSWPALAERLGVYGMWIYGDLPAWSPHPCLRAPDMYRAFQKQHLGWPYSWVPFARSGDSRLLRIARANTGRIIDAAYCHYVSEELSAERGLGYWGVGPICWGRGQPSIRGTFSSVEYLLDAWRLTGCRRAREHVDFYARLYREHPPETSVFGRVTNAQLKTCLDIYEQTFDPWFLAAAHAFSRGHVHGRTQEFHDHIYGGRAWDTGDRDFMRFTGCEAFRDDLYLGRHVPRAVAESEPHHYNRRHPQYVEKAYAWELTGDEYYLRRAVHAVQSGTALIGDGVSYPSHLRGVVHRTNDPQPVTGGGTDYTVFTGYHLKWFPLALRVLADAGRRPDPIVNSFMVSPPVRRSDADDYLRRLTVMIDKQPGAGKIPLRLRAWRGWWSQGPLPDDIRVDYRLTGPGGALKLEGIWDYAERSHPRAFLNHKDIAIPADAPPGVYRLQLLYPGAGGVALPVSARDVPEVLVWEKDLRMVGSSEGVFWFMVPAGVERFWIDFTQGNRGLAMIWDPDGRRVWNQGDHYAASGVVRAEITVPAGQSGRLWRITSPSAFLADPRIPPIYAVEPARWFLPADGWDG